MITYPNLTLERTDPSVMAATEAEQRLFDHYGLAVKTHYVPLQEPQINVRVLESGSGPTVLMVPGGVGDGWIWASLMAELKGYRLIVLNRPGGGLSDGIDHRRVNIRQLAVQTLAAVQDYFGLEQTPVIANSMGGLWSSWFALDRPESVAALVLFGCTATILGTSAPVPMRLLSVPGLNRLLVKTMVPQSLEKARDLPTFLGHSKQVGQNWPEPEAECSYWFPRLPTFETAWLSLMQVVLGLRGVKPTYVLDADELRHLSQPVLYVWGDNDPFGGLEVGRRAQSLSPNAELHEWQGGHLPWWDDVEACGRLVRAFLAK
jgi:pimeloyl-ACP methyl ester carboxylesterase